MTGHRDDPDFSSGPAADVGWLIRMRRREVTLFDSAAGGPLPPESSSPGGSFRSPRAGGPHRRSRRSLVAATLVPAAIAAVAGAFLAPALGTHDGRVLGPETAAAGDLARKAARPLADGGLTPLVSVVERGGRPQLAADGGPQPGAASRPAPPAWISIPEAGVEAPVDGLGATADGLALPDIGRAGWWDGGPRPGEDGRAVVVGHLDSREGPDVFAHVPELSEGDPIVVRDRAGQSHRYAVVGVTRVRKAEFPTSEVYGPAAHPVLVLVTCGGPYDAAIGHYRDNVLVYARAV
jgi:LPXTG-site transpeptidase (sortase) family protein